MTTLTNEPTMKIRALERTDLKNIHIINNKAETMRLWFEEPYESLDELTSLYDKHIHDNTERRFVIEANDTFIGIVELMSIDYIHRTCEIQIIIIDDNSNVSAKNLSTSDLCIVSGSLKSMNESSQIDFDDLRDKDGQAKVGDQIVTSNISDMFLEGIPIGYITDIQTDSNNLTKSGTITPAVDFEHIEEVLVILACNRIDCLVWICHSV